MLESKRLSFAEWQQADLFELKKFLQDEEVMWAYEHAFSQGEVENWLAWNQKSYSENGFGLWKLTEKATGEVIGECGLTLQTVEGQVYPEIGYHLNKEYWHQGFAIEAASAVKNWAFQEQKFEMLATIVRDTNLASMNVAIRNGFIIRKRFIKHYQGVPMPHYLFLQKRHP